MSEILCEWLNEEVKLSRSVVPGSFAEEFSSGYLLGELLHKYGLQDDFNEFSQSRIANAKLNNFSRLEPTLRLLGVKFDKNVAQNIMTGQRGSATKLLYQLYLALEKKKKAKLSGIAMEAMRPAATAKLESVESALFQEHLKTLIPRQADLQLQQISEHFEIKSKAMEDNVARTRIAEQQKVQKLQQEQRSQDSEKHRLGRRRQNEIMARIQAAIIQVPKPLPNRDIKATEARKFLKKKREAEDTYKDIKTFEKSMAGNASAVHSQVLDSVVQESLQTQTLKATTLETTAPTASELLSVYSDDEYIGKIQKRLEEDTFSREQREKRRQKMLMEQLIAHEAQEEAYREEQLIYRLMRQSQQERRIAVELMHIRHEKEVLRQNRIFREKQYQERRLKEFQEALDREKALAKQEKIDYEEEIIKERERHEKHAVERAQARYKKHYSMCWKMINEIIDLATKVGEYRTLTNNKIPLKLMRDWKEFFFHGKPIYEQASIQSLPRKPSPEQLVELNKIALLDDKDYGEYKNMTGEWCPDEDMSENTPPLNNNILSHVLHRLMEIFYPPSPTSSPPVLPPFSITGCILGKIFSGKSTCVKFIEKVCNIQVLSVDTLVQEAIEAYLNEIKSEHNVMPQEAESSGKHSKLSVRAQLGAASQKMLKKGKSIPDDVLIHILLEAINQTPPEKGWIVDGFPMTINQAKLFEKAYTGIDPEANDTNPGKFSLVTDPRDHHKPPVTSPAFDISILLDISDTVVLKRAANLRYKSKSSRAKQEDKNQNPDAGILEENLNLARDKVLHRIAGFLDTWPELETWFSVHQSILRKVNAETEERLVCQTVKEIIMEEMAKKQNRSSTQEISAEKMVLPVTHQELLPPVDVAPPPIEVGSDKWIYVDEPLPKEIPEFLVPYWETIENAYINTIKTILRCLRDEQHSAIYYLADIRKYFQEYLRCPDRKQELVSQWQSDFNSIADDLREDEETKAELHQRVTDLRDHLWGICDNRREEAEQERTGIVNDGWLTDRRGIAMNHFFSLMQVEVDRFQDTKRLLHDYYRAMEGKILTEDSQDFTRIPLLDITDVEQNEDQKKSRRISLVSWKLPPPETDIAKSKVKGNLQKSAKDETSENGVAISRKDESFITDTWQTAVTAVSDMVTAEIQFKEMEEEDQQRELNVTLSGKATGKGVKDAKKLSPKSATKKKGAQSTASEVSLISLTPEQIKKQELAQKIKEEYFGALRHEELATKSRLELIKGKALAFVEDLTRKADEAYKDMEKWLGSRFLAEMSSVEKLIEVARHHIESSSKIQYRITLEETDFFISGDIKVSPDPVPSPHVPHIETSKSGTLTISQLTTLHKQFLQVAPRDPDAGEDFITFERKVIVQNIENVKCEIPNCGKTVCGGLRIPCAHQYDCFIQKEVFSDIFNNLINLDLGSNCLPDGWMNLMLPDLQNLASEFTVNSEFIDWRRFLLAAAQPWPVPSVTQLLKTLHNFESVDAAGSGFVTQENYMQIGLWFNGTEDLNVTRSCTEALPLDRLEHLIKFFFSLFADTREDPALLNYNEMLLYFASHSDPVEGVYRALSVATGTHIHRKKEASLLCEGLSYTNEVPNEEILIEDEKEVLNYICEETISVATLLKVFHTGGSKEEDNNRFSNPEKEDSYDKHFIKVFKELGSEDLTPIPVALLLEHPFIQNLINVYQEYRLPDIKTFLQRAEQAQ